MTTYTDFANKMLVALYQESENGEPYPEGITFDDLIERYGLPDNSRWVDRLAQEWKLEGLAEVSDQLDAVPGELQVEITGRGMRRIEETYGDKDGVGTILEPAVDYLITEDGDYLVTEDGDRIIVEDRRDETAQEGKSAVESLEVPSFASANWTGISERLGPDQRARIDELNAALLAAIDQSNLDRKSKITATKHVQAIQTLLEAPDPPWKAIVELLNYPAVTAFLVAVQMLQLIWGAAN